MAYTKPVIVAQNSSSGSYAAGCPTGDTNNCDYRCTECERAQ